jgi:hypothetical protein
MVHIDVKKLGRIHDGGGWRAHGRDSDHSRAATRNKKRTGRGGLVYLTPRSTGTPASPRRRSRSCTEPGHGLPHTASPASNGSSPTVMPATAPTRSPAPCSGHGINGPDPTPPSAVNRPPQHSSRPSPTPWPHTPGSHAMDEFWHLTGGAISGTGVVWSARNDHVRWLSVRTGHSLPRAPWRPPRLRANALSLPGHGMSFHLCGRATHYGAGCWAR